MDPRKMTTEEKAKAFDKIAKLCVEEMTGAADLAKTPEGRSSLGARGSFVKDVAEMVFEEAMAQVYGPKVFTTYNKYF